MISGTKTYDVEHKKLDKISKNTSDALKNAE